MQTNPDRRPDGPVTSREGILRSRGLKGALLLEVAVLAVVVLSTVSVSRLPVASSGTTEVNVDFPWIERRAALEDHLDSWPDDGLAQVQLATVLMRSSVQRAQVDYPVETAGDHSAESERYHAHLYLRLSVDPEYAQAYRLARDVARRSPDPQARARAWRAISMYHSQLGERTNQGRALEAAHNESPSEETSEATRAFRNWIAARGNA